MAEMYVQGVSTRKVSKIVEELCGDHVSSTQVSSCTAKLGVELQLWRERALGAFSYLVLDARYEKVRHGGILVDCATLIAMGIGPDGKRTILGVSVALSDAEAHLPRLDLRTVVAADIRSIFNSPDLASAQARLRERVSHYSESAPKLSAWMEQNPPEGSARVVDC